MLVSGLVAGAEEPVDFNRDIRPILSENCYFCHGPDAAERKAGMRLDIRAAALEAGAFVPGDAEKSELHRRIHESDPDEIMPPPKSKLTLTAEQKALLDRWIESGAEYKEHWSFVAPERPGFPELPDDLKSWARNGIDHFVAKRLADEELRPSREAGRETLIRRATLDLTGLPPTPAEVDAFLADESDSAYEKVVDRLLASKHYGERMALVWLDAARYADTGGYQGDIQKTQWPWRDWVIGAYNDNVPFDRFTILQLAGDLLPDPTEDERLATAFNRNHRINDEGGIIPEEFRVEYVADRVETTSTVWMGLTVGCARCHDHKYDPITQRDFFELFAFFNNIPEQGKDGDLAPKPNMQVYTGGTKKEHESLRNKLAGLEREKSGYAAAHAEKFSAWMEKTAAEARKHPAFAELPAPALHLPLDEFDNTQTANLAPGPKLAVVRGVKNRFTVIPKAKHSGGLLLRQGGYLDAGKQRDWTPDEPASWSAWLRIDGDIAGIEGPIFSRVSQDAKREGYHVNLIERAPGTFAVGFRLHSDRKAGKGVEVISKATVPQERLFHVAVTYDGEKKAGGVRVFIDGKESEAVVGNDTFDGAFTTEEKLLIGAETEASSDKGIRDELLGNTLVDDARVYDVALNDVQIAALHRISPEGLLAARSDNEQRERTHLSRSYFRDHDSDYQAIVKEFETAKAVLEGFEKYKMTSVSIMEEMPESRPTYLLRRGAYDQPDESTELEPATLSALPPMSDELPQDRLGLAEWLLLPEHPLTARVAVNRHWQMYFGNGLVRTPEDFGSQGQAPTHPDLLDWLAVEFRESGWDVKAMQKLIVTSATYRQRSAIPPGLAGRDPENRLLARGPRFRLYGQALRDQALAIGGQLDDRIGGPPVMPYQPAGLWEEVSAKGVKYIVGDGSDLYRRSLYTFWRRTVPPPSMMNFDNATRENCSVVSTRTNTPLQAMNLMNDPQYVEAARLMAERMMREGGTSITDRIRYGHRLALARHPDEYVLKILTNGHADYLATYRADPEAAASLVGVGKSEAEGDLDPARLAAMTAVASILLNLDETVTKE